LEQEAQHDDRLTVISLSRNFGHQAALTAALDYVDGDVTILIDGDLQDPPELIPQFLEQYAVGYDVVYAVRASRSEVWWLRSAYFVFYRILSVLSTVKLPFDSGDFSLLSRRVVEQLRATRERHRFLRGLRAWVGFRQSAILVERPGRFAGTSKYSLRKLLRLAFDGVFAFSVVPIRASLFIGALAITVTGLFALYALYAKLFMHQVPQGFTALTLLLTFFFGMQLLFMGVIGEYVGRVYEEVKARPLYVIDRVIGRGNGRSRMHAGDIARPYE